MCSLLPVCRVWGRMGWSGRFWVLFLLDSLQTSENSSMQCGTELKPALVFSGWVHSLIPKKGRVPLWEPPWSGDGDMQGTFTHRCAPTEVLFSVIRNLTIWLTGSLGWHLHTPELLCFTEILKISVKLHTELFWFFFFLSVMIKTKSQRYIPECSPATALQSCAGACVGVWLWTKRRVLCNGLKNKNQYSLDGIWRLIMPNTSYVFLFLLIIQPR